MCSRLDQAGNVVGPGHSRARVRLGSGEMFDQAVFAGCARKERLRWWKRQGLEEVTIRALRYAERNKTTKELTWFDVPAGEVVQGLLEPQPPGKDYRLLKIVTRPATEEEFDQAGNDRFPVTLQEEAA